MRALFSTGTAFIETAITKEEARKLYTKWETYNAAYHNGESLVTDAEFDRLTKKLLPYYPGLDKRVGAAPMALHASARKVRLLYPMNSLDKAYSKDVARVTKIKMGSVAAAIVSEKVDGASLQLVKNSKGKASLFTRGKDGIGQDVSHLLPYIKGLGGIAKGEAIRFELVLPHSVSLDEEEGAGVRRNAISGIINARSPNLKILAKAWPVALSYMDPPMAPAAAFKRLKAQGWRVPKHQKVDVADLDDNFLTALYKSWRDKALFAIDGLVVSANRAETPKITNPKLGYAFKLNEAGPTAEVVRVRWQVSRYNVLKPVVDIKPTKLDGVTVKKATGHNAKYIVDNKIGPGAKIEIIRSGSVIPYIVSVKRAAAKADLPPAGSYEWDKTKVNIVSIDEDDDAAAHARRLQTFFTKNGALGFGPALAALVDDCTVAEVCRLTPEDWLERGAGPANANKMPGVIKSAMRTTTVPKIMAYCGIFGQGFGDSSANDLWALVNESPPTSKAILAAELAELNGWSTNSAKETANAWGKWVVWFNKLPYKPAKKEPVKAVSNKLKGKVVVFTGVRDTALIGAIIANGGQYSERITKDTTHLVYKEGKESIKTAKAEADNIILVPLGDARRVFKL